MIFADVDAALSEVPVNAAPLTDDTDFKSLETSVAYNASGMALYWHFFTVAGAYTVTQVTPTTSGTYDWAHQAQGMYTIEIPASGGASINNDTEGFGYFTGFVTGVLPFRGPTICFRAAALNDLLIENAYSTTRGLAGTALPAAAADAAGGLPISDAGGLDLDAKIGALTYGTANRVNAQVYGMEAGTVTATAIANGAIDAATFAADVDAEILSYIVDDATRVDASALNTLSGHDPGGTLASASDASTIESAITALNDITAADVWSYATRVLTAGTNLNDLNAAGVRSAVGLASANLDTQLTTLLTKNKKYFQLITRGDSAVASDLATELGELNADTGSGTGAYDNTEQSLEELSTDIGSISAAPTAAEIADAVWEEAIADHSGTAGSTAEALSDAGGAGTPPTAAEVADAVLDELLSGHAISGSAGKALSDILASALDTNSDLAVVASAISALNDITAADVWAVATRTLTAGTNIVLAKGTGVTGFNDPTAAANADAVWDEILSGHSTSGSAGAALATVPAVGEALIALTDALIPENGVVADTGATTTVFKSTLQWGTYADDYWNDAIIVMTSGALDGQSRPVLDFSSTNSTFTVSEPFTSAPADGVAFTIHTGHVHPVSQIADGVLDRVATGHTTNSTLGAIINDWENGGRLDLLVDGIISDAATLASSLSVVDSNVDAILDDTGTAGVIVASLSSGAVDSIHDDAISEPSGMFAWSSATPRKIMATLGVLMRNEIDSDANSVDVRNDADDTNLWSYASSDDGTTYTSGEAA